MNASPGKPWTLIPRRINMPGLVPLPNPNQHYAIVQIALPVTAADQPMPKIFDTLSAIGGRRLNPTEAEQALGQDAPRFRETPWNNPVVIAAVRLPQQSN